jgi:hypothetical protein
MAQTQMKKSEEGAMAIPSFGQNQGRGSEHVGAQDITIPRLAIIQSLSPQRKKNDPEYIPGAEEGMMFNSVTKALYDKTILVVPIYYRLEFLLWKIRAEGGGFRGVFDTRESALMESRELKETTEVVDTGQQFCLLSSDNGKTWTEVVMSMAKSNQSVSKTWNADIRLRTQEHNLDRFTTIYEVGAVSKSNDKGDFFVFSVNFLRFMSDGERPLYDRCEKVYESIARGEKNIDRAYESEPESAGGDGLGF